MQISTIRQLNNLNRSFYESVAEDFDRSRGHYWPGWEQLLQLFDNFKPEPIRILDVGCGNGRFGQFLQEKLTDKKIKYTGTDQNRRLLEIAQEKLGAEQVHFQETDVLEALETGYFIDKEAKFDFVALFGILHHIPGFFTREKLIFTLAEQLSPGGIMAISIWNFPKYERFQKKIVSPAEADINPDQLEENDFILSWDQGVRALRYCHHLDEQEQQKLLDKLPNLSLLDRFRADGREGDVNTYLILQNVVQ